MLCIRLDDLTLGLSNKGELNAQVIRATYLGSLTDYLLQLGEMTVRVQSKNTEFSKGDEVSLIFDKEKIILY